MQYVHPKVSAFSQSGKVLCHYNLLYKSFSDLVISIYYLTAEMGILIV